MQPLSDHTPSPLRGAAAWLYPLLIALAFGLCYGYIFDEKVHLNGDNAHYYILGKALAEGEGYTNIHHIEKDPHKHYPIGYPLIIAGVMKVFGDDFTTIKIANGVFFLLALLTLYLIVWRLTDKASLALLSCLLTLLNVHLLGYATIMMSEVPFLFFSLLALLLFIRTDFQKPAYKNGSFLLLVLCIVIACYIRSTGIALLAATSLFFLFSRKWMYFTGQALLFAVLFAPGIIRSTRLGGSTYLQQLTQINPYRPELGSMAAGDWFVRISENFARYLSREIPSGTFNFITVSDYKAPVSGVEYLVGMGIIGLFFLGFRLLPRYRKLLLFYVLATFGILLLWPPVWYGVRFMLPLIPLFSLLVVVVAFRMTEVLMNRLGAFRRKPQQTLAIMGAGILLLALYAWPPLHSRHKEAAEPLPAAYEEYFALAEWLSTHAADTAVTASRKSELFYLYSGQPVARYTHTTDADALLDDLIANSVDYVVGDHLGFSSTERYLYPAISRDPYKFHVIHREGNSYLMQFKPQLGYFGERKEGLPSGMGRYVYEDGSRHEGMYSGGKRHGTGMLYSSIDFRLEAEWVNGLTQGEAHLYDPAGKLLKTFTYRNDTIIHTVVHD